ncbi:MAG: hypothetical protein KAJ81_00695 [Candidatus Latescibacteria bacterium]|nr:hypothetical protein [Candidatus Latescibacterota bacterium]
MTPLLSVARNDGNILIQGVSGHALVGYSYSLRRIARTAKIAEKIKKTEEISRQGEGGNHPDALQKAFFVPTKDTIFCGIDQEKNFRSFFQPMR